ncbi:energy transducer TonB [Sporomusa sp.]|uniref:energy transducer TonB n=1 Tax=Sporomusa sp. TaxID=2078658 RepID=UPI002CBC179C|nr:energy transducer TonB [Sporomusa sp.]HWR06572.1 energy transducer TonB [Sporomusa sp.]
MKYLSKSPYIKATGISLLLHGALIVCLAMLGPPYPAEKPAERTAIEVDIVPVAMIETGDAEPPASPDSSPPAPAEQPVSRLTPDTTRTKSVAQAVAAVASSAFATAAASSETVAVSGNGGNFNAGAGGGNNHYGGGRTSPAYLYGSRPAYPQAARKAGWEGAVVVRALIDTAGTVASVSVKEGSGYDILDEAAVQAVKKWRYTPAKEGGVPVTSLHDIRVRFRLDEAD